MSSESNSKKAREVIDLAKLAIETASMDGGMTELDLEVRYLLDEDPHGQTSSDELHDAIVRWGLAHGVGVEFGQKVTVH